MMDQYILLLRGVNVGGKNKVPMNELKGYLSELGYTHIVSYINSGNLIFSSNESMEQLRTSIENLLSEKYSFRILFALIARDDYISDAQALPSWWYGDMARKDVLFFTDKVDKVDMRKRIEAMKLGNEKVHFGKVAVYWGKYSMADYLKTAYAKHVLTQPFYRQVTIRNGNTHSRLLKLLDET